MSSSAVWLNGNLLELYPKAEGEEKYKVREGEENYKVREGEENYKVREGEESGSDMHIHTYLVMQMHIAIFGVGLSFSPTAAFV